MSLGTFFGVCFWIVLVFFLFGCDVKSCKESELYVGGYQEIEYPSGDKELKPILYCPE